VTALLPAGADVPPAQAEHKARADRLFAELAELPPGPARDRVRHELVEMHVPLVRFFVRRYAGRSQPYDDLLQAGCLGLVKAVDRFDPERGLQFSTYAAAKIVGEIKRHFRDRAWPVHVEPTLRELVLLVLRASAELTQRLGRPPTVAELSRHLGQAEEAVGRAMACASACRALSLDDPAGTDRTVADLVGGEDDALDGVELHESLGPALTRLPERERRILQLRFYGNMSQREIADRVGVSQMHVSRILTRTLRRLRADLLDEGPAPRPRPLS
jgi:RNA polymerase sigma-B factor